MEGGPVSECRDRRPAEDELADTLRQSGSLVVSDPLRRGLHKLSLLLLCQ